MHAGTEAAAGHPVHRHLDDGHRRRVGPLAHRALLEALHPNRHAEGRHRSLDRAIALAGKYHRLAAHLRLDADALPAARLEEVVGHVAHRRIGLEILLTEERPQLVGIHLLAAAVGEALHRGAELHLHPPGHHEAVVGLEQVRDTALARLAVHADHRIVAAAEVGRVDGHVGHGPRGIRTLALEALLDRVLVGTREGREHEIAHVGVARMHRQLGAFLADPGHRIDVREIEAGVDALGVHVEREGHHVHVAGALAIAEEAALDPVGARKHRELGRGHGGATVVVGMHAEDDLLAAGEVAVHPLHLVGVHVGHRHLDGGREVEDHLLARLRVPGGDHRIAHLAGKIELGGGEGFGAVLEHELGARLLGGELLDEHHAVDGKLADFVPAHPEHGLAEDRRGSVVDVHDDPPRAAHRFHGAADKVLAGLAQDLDGHVVGDLAVLDELADEVEISLGGRGESDFDLLEADRHELAEHLQLAGGVHGFEEGLVAVAEIGAHPDRRMGDLAAGPLAVGEGDRGKGGVLGVRVLQHDDLVLCCRRMRCE